MLNFRIPELVSVVITNNNREPYLLDCLNSIVKQTYLNWEIIFVDDASTDGSLMQVKQWLRNNYPYFPNNNSFITVVLQRNIGYAGAMTTGLYMTQGEFIAVQDSDDISHPLRLEKQITYLNNHPQIDLVGTNYAAFKDELNVGPYEKSDWIQYGEQIRNIYQHGGHCVCHGTIMLRGNVFDRIGGHTRRVLGAEDYDFITRYLDPKQLNIENLPDILYYYREHSNQRSRKYFNKKSVQCNDN